MTTQKQAHEAFSRIIYLKYGDDGYYYHMNTLHNFIDEHPDPEPPKPTVDEMLDVLDTNMPYLREDMVDVLQRYYGAPVYVTVS